MADNDDYDYRAHPESIGERKAQTTGNAIHWTPRDVLISLLREIDSGEIHPTAMVVCVEETNPEDKNQVRAFFKAACPNLHVSIGLVEMVKHYLISRDA